MMDVGTINSKEILNVNAMSLYIPRVTSTRNAS